MSQTLLRLRIRFGEKEVELSGDIEEVISTINKLDEIVERVSKGSVVESNIAPLEVMKAKAKPSTIKLLNIPSTTKCSEAVLSLLSTDWGRTPRRISELKEAMEANEIFYPKTTLSRVLVACYLLLLPLNGRR